MKTKFDFSKHSLGNPRHMATIALLATLPIMAASAMADDDERVPTWRKHGYVNSAIDTPDSTQLIGSLPGLRRYVRPLVVPNVVQSGNTQQPFVQTPVADTGAVVEEIALFIEPRDNDT